MALPVPARYTECEEYRGWVIATYRGVYRGFGDTSETVACNTRAECREQIGSYVDRKL